MTYRAHAGNAFPEACCAAGRVAAEVVVCLALAYWADADAQHIQTMINENTKRCRGCVIVNEVDGCGS